MLVVAVVLVVVVAIEVVGADDIVVTVEVVVVGTLMVAVAVDIPVAAQKIKGGTMQSAINLLATAVVIYLTVFAMVIFMLARMHERNTTRHRLWSCLYIIAFAMACGLCAVPLVGVYIVLIK